MSASKAKFTRLSGEEPEAPVFKATMHPALKLSYLRTALDWLAVPSPLLLLVGLFMRVPTPGPAAVQPVGQSGLLLLFSLYLIGLLMGKGLHVVASKVPRARVSSHRPRQVIFPAQMIAKEKSSWLKVSPPAACG